MAYGTLTEYCIHELGYGDTSASRRVRAARVIKDIPEVYDLLKKRELTFSAVVLVYSVLTPENKDELLPRLVGKSRSEIEYILAEYRMPRKIFDQAKPTLVKKLVVVEGAPAGASSKSAAGEHTLEVGEMTRHSDGSNDPGDKIATPEVKEVLERMFEIRFAADEELMELIRWLKSYLSHKYPKGASFLEIFKYAMNYVREREDLSRRKESNRRSNAKSDSRYIPKSVKQKVWSRDQGKCSFVGANGRRCNSKYNLQFDHFPIPYARGGPSTVSNLRLLCAKHNKYMAEMIYGKAHVAKYCVKETPAVYSLGRDLSTSVPINMLC
jgi:5-methylcytosine-specific restriction endonuclease McrA